jgi:glycosyltransferase involved in cell wall biosynthesis
MMRPAPGGTTVSRDDARPCGLQSDRADIVQTAIMHMPHGAGATAGSALPEAAGVGQNPLSSDRPPRVSVVIPAFRASAVVTQAIDSVAAQSFRDLEVILVDDASPDDTAEIAEACLKAHGLRHVVLRQPRNAGPSETRNRGVAIAQGEYVAFLDADDVWLPNKLAAQVAVLDRHPGVRICGCPATWTDPNGNELEPLYTKLPDFLEDGWKILLWNCFIATSCAMVRRVDLGTEPFDKTLRVGEDRDLWIRLASNGHVALASETRVLYRRSPGSFMPRNRPLMVTDTKRMAQAHIAAFGRSLSLAERLRARGHLYTAIGKSLIDNPDGYAPGALWLLRAMLMMYRPVDNFREILFRSPIVRNLRRHLKPVH